MADLATQEMDLDGLVASYSAAAAGGDTFTPGDDVFLHVKNGHTSAQTVTVATPNTAAGGLAIADSVTSVPNAGEAYIGPFPARHFGRSSDGKADITYSGVIALTLAVVKAPRRL